jgi:hypothetical protein
MSLCIDVNAVSAVLLADGWHEVAHASFNLDAYEYAWSGDASLIGTNYLDMKLLHGGGESGICATGFGFEAPDGSRMFGPLSAVLAVRECMPKADRTRVNYEARVMEVLAASPEPMSKGAIRQATGITSQQIGAAFDALLARGLIEQGGLGKTGYVLYRLAALPAN